MNYTFQEAPTGIYIVTLEKNLPISLPKVWTPSEMTDLNAAMWIHPEYHTHFDHLSCKELIAYNPGPFPRLFPRATCERTAALYCSPDYVLQLVSYPWLVSPIAPLIVRYRLEQGV